MVLSSIVKKFAFLKKRKRKKKFVFLIINYERTKKNLTLCCTFFMLKLVHFCRSSRMLEGRSCGGGGLIFFFFFEPLYTFI